jgi:alpha-D-ribose 1-methylphosphonate 5-triphosphate synthase subunit PhnH
MSDTISLPGFADPVGEAQATFRAVLDAMARPGRLHKVGERLTAPAPLDQATAAVLLTLVDNETPLWLDATATPARDWLAFHCGAAIIEAAERAAFALALSMPDLAALPAGTHEAPEDSATLILQIATLGTGARYRLSGPGLREPAVMSAGGLPAGFAAAWQRNHAQYPCGVDIILCAGAVLAALPRSVSIEEA